MVSTSPEPPRLNCTPCEDPEPSEGPASSDSEDEQLVNYEGYELLPQQFEEEESAPYGNIPNHIDCEPVNQGNSTGNSVSNDDPMKAEREERMQLWSGPGGRDVVEMDATRTQEVLQAMAGFALPSSAVPAWASNVPEEQWRARLEERLKAMNSTQLSSPKETE